MQGESNWRSLSYTLLIYVTRVCGFGSVLLYTFAFIDLWTLGMRKCGKRVAFVWERRTAPYNFKSPTRTRHVWIYEAWHVHLKYLVPNIIINSIADYAEKLMFPDVPMSLVNDEVNLHLSEHFFLSLCLSLDCT